MKVQYQCISDLLYILIGYIDGKRDSVRNYSSYRTYVPSQFGQRALRPIWPYRSLTLRYHQWEQQVDRTFIIPKATRDHLTTQLLAAIGSFFCFFFNRTVLLHIKRKFLEMRLIRWLKHTTGRTKVPSDLKQSRMRLSDRCPAASSVVGTVNKKGPRVLHGQLNKMDVNNCKFKLNARPSASLFQITININARTWTLGSQRQ